MADPNSLPVLSSDPTPTLMGIHQALLAFARTIPHADVPQVVFTQQLSSSEISLGEPNGDPVQWEAIATLTCYSNLERMTEVDPLADSDMLNNVEPEVVYQNRWKAMGAGIGGSIEALSELVEEHFLTVIRQYDQNSQTMTKALDALRPLASSQDDHPQEVK